MRPTELQLLESKLDSIASRITYNRGTVDSINEQIKTLTYFRKEYNALIVAECKELTDTINQIKTIKYHTENPIT